MRSRNELSSFGDVGARRVIGVGDEDQFGAVVDERGQRGEIVAIAVERREHRVLAGGLRDQPIHHEGRPGRGHQLVGADEGAHQEVDDVVAPVAHHDPRRVHAELGAEGVLELGGGAVGVQMRSGQGALGSGDRALRRAEHVLIGRQQQHLSGGSPSSAASARQGLPGG